LRRSFSEDVSRLIATAYGRYCRIPAACWQNGFFYYTQH
jgi:hypothetical protein